MVGAHYDSFLQRALRRFFERAALESESVPSPSSDGRLAIEPTADPGALVVRWFGNRYVLRVPRQQPFTDNEVRFARAIGTVLSARFHAILKPQAIIERSGLFRGAIEDRYVGAFFDPAPYGGASEPGVDRVSCHLDHLPDGPANTARCVDAQPRRLTAEHSPHRLIGGLAGEVPQREIERPWATGVELDICQHGSMTIEVARRLPDEVARIVGKSVHHIA